MTACFGLLQIGQPKPGETVFVSGAAGAAGSRVGQIAGFLVRLAADPPDHRSFPFSGANVRAR